MGAQRRGLHEVAFGAQGTIHLIGGHLQVLLALFPGLGFGIIPGILAALQQVDRAQDVAFHKDFGVLDAAVHVAFRREVDDVVGVILDNQVGDQRLIADIPLHKDMTGIPLDVLEVLQIAGIGQLVQVHQTDILVFLQHVVDKVGADKTGAAGDKIGFHYTIILRSSLQKSPSELPASRASHPPRCSGASDCPERSMRGGWRFRDGRRHTRRWCRE